MANNLPGNLNIDKLIVVKTCNVDAEIPNPVAMIGLHTLQPSRQMISNSPHDQVQFRPEKEPESDPNIASANVLESESHSRTEQWLDRIADDWSKTVKKVTRSKLLSKVSKKTFRQLCYGLDAGLIARATPLIKHVSSKGRKSHDFEQLASLAESIASSVHALEHEQLESFSAEVDDQHPAAELPLLAAFSSLLVANRIRSVVVDGTDQQFERVIRSLTGLEKIISADETVSPLLYQWLAIELPLTIASQLIAIKPFKKEGKLAAQRFVDVTRELLDSDGWPIANSIQHFGPLAASWTRSVRLAKACKFKLGASFQSQIEWVAEQFVRLHGPKRKLVFCGDRDAKSSEEFVEFVLELDSDVQTRRLAEASGLLKPATGKKQKGSGSDQSLAEPSCVSEWSGSAILKSAWALKSPQVTLDFSRVHSFIEVAAKERLIVGEMALEIRDDGRLVDFQNSSFDVVCDLNDEDICYLELELAHQGLKIHRQLLLSKTDDFLFFADSVTKESAGEIDYRLKLPLSTGIDVIRENGTRELYLNRKGKGIQSLVLPVSLPEWSAERCRGLLSTTRDESLLGAEALNIESTVQLQSDGGALYCPMFIDLNPKRSRLKRTWRRLTVAERLEIVRPDVAAAFRVQVGEEQWLFYRALRSTGNRTFMGQNFSGDFYAGKFGLDGSVQDLIHIE